MAKRNPNGPKRNVAPGVLAAIAIVVFGVLVYYVKNGPSADLKPADNSVTVPGIEIDVPVAKTGGPDATYTTKKIIIPPGTDAVVASVNGFLESLQMVPPEARLIETKKQGENLELVFTSNFRMTYGTDDESTILKGIMRAVRANSAAKTVTLMEGGRPIETLGSADLMGQQSVRDWIGG